jgi:hypothetical protein
MVAEQKTQRLINKPSRLPQRNLQSNIWIKPRIPKGLAKYQRASKRLNILSASISWEHQRL